MKKQIPLILLSLVLCGCKPDPNAIKSKTKIAEYHLKYNEVVLDWSKNCFSHNGYDIKIPEKWGAGILGVRDRFRDEINCHDIQFSYDLYEKEFYSGNKERFTQFCELKKINEEKKNEIFYINTNKIDIESKILIKDELIDDYYFKVDFFENFNNFCYFKIAKNDVNQIRSGPYNQINVKLKYFQHYDSTNTFEIDKNKDGLNDIGFYSDVSIAYNPENEI